jgi:hypothetical protein
MDNTSGDSMRLGWTRRILADINTVLDDAGVPEGDTTSRVRVLAERCREYELLYGTPGAPEPRGVLSSKPDDQSVTCRCGHGQELHIPSYHFGRIQCIGNGPCGCVEFVVAAS